MNYEKIYKEALEKAKKELSVCGSMDCDAAKQIFRFFPELKESEDERIKKEIIGYLNRRITFSNFGGNIAIFQRWIFWLEKQGERKPMWSKEDEGELYLTISLLDEFKKEAYTNDCENCINWLKSLKPQSHWKPTDEQIRALSMAYKDSLTSGENLITQTETLKSLYDDLKKL